MKFHSFSHRFNFHVENEYGLLIGFYGGRVHFPYSYRKADAQWIPGESGWLYSLRIFLILYRIEICWRTKG